MEREVARYRCDPCGFSSGVIVNGHDTSALRVGDRASLSLVACPRCGRRNGSNVAWLAFLASVPASAGIAGGALLAIEDASHVRALGVVAFAVGCLIVAVALQRFRGARRAVKFLPY
jgi:predicted RNA-binding Zn-ribbon protein involved in translation (DUF1610 family)